MIGTDPASLRTGRAAHSGFTGPYKRLMYLQMMNDTGYYA